MGPQPSAVCDDKNIELLSLKCICKIGGIIYFQHLFILQNVNILLACLRNGLKNLVTINATLQKFVTVSYKISP